MSRKSTQRARSRRGTVSRALATGLTTLEKRMVLASALSPRGALRRTLVLQFLLMVSTALRWWSRLWSRSYLGRRLGLSWSKQTYQTGARRVYEPADIGNEWKQFADGRVTMRPPSKQ